ncbi:hypothetical protein GE09DRAFT_220721 [Coniochaeta sp. 2T2.1]|nr:hypothetical protein GE09DRAFT_220721 [Coniochaeta sp. 2T2.1]
MRLPLALGTVLSLLPSLGQAAFENDFSSYPKNAQQCLYNAATWSGCGGDTAMAMNSCLCSNGGNFVTTTATCLGSSDAADLGTVYDTMRNHCADSNTPLTVSKAQFLKESGATLTSSTTRSATGSRTSSTTSTTGTSTSSTTSESPTSTAAGKDNGGDEEGNGGEKETLSSTARAGIIAGSTSGGVLLLGIVAFFFVRRKRANGGGREEAHPMLFHKIGGNGAIGGFDAAVDGRGHHTGLVAAHHDGLEVADGEGIEETEPVMDQKQKWRQSQRFNWESPYEPPWIITEEDAATKPSRDPSPPLQGGYNQVEQEIHELASPEMQAPIELAATPLDGQHYLRGGWGTGR